MSDICKPIALFVLILCLNACKQTSPQDKTHSGSLIYERFLDSVKAQARLPISQVERYVPLAKIEYYTKQTTFEGDTIWYRNSKHMFVIIRYDDHAVCLRKLLLVLNESGECTASLTVETGCDIDGSTDSWDWSYKIFNDTSFSRTETYTKRAGRKDDLIIVTEQFYKISNQGEIIPLYKKTHSFTRPKNSEDES